MTSGNFSFRLDDEKDRGAINDLAKRAGFDKGSTLFRSILRAIKQMSPEELRELVARGNQGAK